MDKKSKNQKSEYSIVNSLLSQQGMAIRTYCMEMVWLLALCLRFFAVT